MGRPDMLLLVVLAASLYAGEVSGQPREGTSEAKPCKDKKEVKCPFGWSGSFTSYINLKMLPSSGGQTCQFDRNNMDSPSPAVTVKLGQDATFDICNACDVNVVVQLDTWTGSWKDHFDFTLPFGSGNDVSVDVPCRGYEKVTGYRAKQKGSFHTWARVRLPNVAQFHDNLDPELEIEDRHNIMKILEFLLIFLGTFGIGWWLGRRRGAQKPAQ